MIDLDAQIANWASWVRTKPSRSHCRSIEHLYTPPKHWWPESPRAAIDVFAALDVERAMCVVPTQHRQALIWHYAAKAPSSYICRKLVLRRTDWDRFLDDARTMLKNILRFQEQARIRSITTRHQHIAETLAPTGA
jgi:hypothetical protein